MIMKRLFPVLLRLIVLISLLAVWTEPVLAIDSSAAFPLGEKEQIQIQNVVQLYFEIRYRAFNKLQLDSFGDIIATSPDAKEFLASESKKLEVEIKHKEQEHLRFLQYQYSLDFKDIAVDSISQTATVLVTEGYDVIFERSAEIFPDDPIVSSMRNLEHTFVLRYEQDKWKIASDLYTDYLWRMLRKTKISPDEMLSNMDSSQSVLSEERLEIQPSISSSLPEDESSHPYNRDGAIDYAHRWALAQPPYNSPPYFDFTNFGGDCTNFVSQAMHEGSDAQMIGSGTYGWYFNSLSDYAAAWTGVSYLYDFITDYSVWEAGPEGREVSQNEAEPGDLIQFDWANDGVWDHTAIIVLSQDDGQGHRLHWVAAHSDDVDNFLFTDYAYQNPDIVYRFIHIERIDGYATVTPTPVITSTSVPTTTPTLTSVPLTTTPTPTPVAMTTTPTSTPVIQPTLNASSIIFVSKEEGGGGTINCSEYSNGQMCSFDIPASGSELFHSVQANFDWSGTAGTVHFVIDATAAGTFWYDGPAIDINGWGYFIPGGYWSTGSGPSTGTGFRQWTGSTGEWATFNPYISIEAHGGIPSGTSGNFSGVFYVVPQPAPTATPTPTCDSGWFGIQNCSQTSAKQSNIDLINASDDLNAFSSIQEVVVDALLYYRVRDELLSLTPQGNTLINLHYQYEAEITGLLLADPNLYQEGIALLQYWEPKLQALVDGQGDTMFISQEEVNAVDHFLSGLEAVGSNDLRTAIQNEKTDLNMQGLVGQTMSQAWEEIGGISTATPTFTSTPTDTPTTTPTSTPTFTPTNTPTYTPTSTSTKTATPTATGTTNTITLQPNGASGMDTYLLSASPATTYGTSAEMGVGEANIAAGAIGRSLIKFDLSSIPSNATITSATLSLWTSTDYSTNTRAIHVYRLKVPFNESQATWNIASTGTNWQTAGASGANDRESSDIGSIQILSNEPLNTEKQISLSTAQIQELIDGTFTNNGFIVVADTELNDGFMYKTSDNGTASQRPKLVIHYTAPPATPTNTPTPTLTPTPSNTPTPTNTGTPTSTPSGDFPNTFVLDDFNRANGSIGSNWAGSDTAYTLSSNRLDVVGDGAILWQAGPYSADQEAFVTMTTVDANGGEQDLLLKAQSNSSWMAGVIEVWYDAPSHLVRVVTYEYPNGWVQHGTGIPVTFANGDQFGARATADGMVEVYKNGTLMGTRNITSWSHYADGGYLGLWLIGAQNAVLDDFGGGTLAGGESLMSGQMSSSSLEIETSQLDMELTNADAFWQGVPLDLKQEAVVKFAQLNKTTIMQKPESNGVWGEDVVQVLYDVSNQRIQVWMYDSEQGWVQQGKNIPVKFVDGDKFSVCNGKDGTVEIYRNGKLLAKRDVMP